MMNKIKFLMLPVLVLSVSVLFSSCLKDTPYMDVADTGPIIEFGISPASSESYPQEYSPYGVTSDTTIVAGDTTITPVVPQNDTAFAVVLASPQVINDSIAVTLEIDASQIAPFNAANSTSYTQLPANLYSAVQTVVTILPSHRVGRIPISLFFQSFPASYHYALPFTIVSAVDKANPKNAIVVSGNSGQFMWLFDQ